MDFDRYNSMTIEELEAEKKDLVGAINNESLWCLGTHTAAEFNMMASNVNSLQNALEYVGLLIEERKRSE